MAALEPFDDELGPLSDYGSRRTRLHEGFDPDLCDWDPESPPGKAIRAVSVGLTVTQAAHSSGIDKSLLGTWLKRGDQLEPRGDQDPIEVLSSYTKNELLYLWFKRRALGKKADVVLEVAEKAYAAAKTSGQFSFKWLERRDPDNWATTANHVIRSDVGVVADDSPTALHELMGSEDVRELVDRIERAVASQRAAERGVPVTAPPMDDIVDAEIIDDDDDD